MGLQTLDYVLLAISLVISAAIGIFYGVRGIKSTPLEYLLGGRSMRPLPLAMSMMMGTVSAITIMGNAGEMYGYGTQLWVMDLGMALAMILVAKVIIPIMYPLQCVSLYQYIEKRFKSHRLRKATVLLQLIGGYLFIGFTLYPPSIALLHLTHLSILTNIFIMGIICTIYSSVGGVKAIVYSDVYQAFVMVAGVLGIVIQGSVKLGGLDHVWNIAFQGNRTQLFNMSLDPYQRHSFWLCTTFGFFFALSLYGVNQNQTQRFFSTGSVKQAQWVLYYAAICMVFLKGIINLAGLVIYAHYKDCDPSNYPKQDISSVVVVYVLMVLTEVPGIAGLFVSAIYAAVLSSVSTQLNSIAALLWDDFLKEIDQLANFTEAQKGSVQKLIVLFSGVVGIILGIVVSNLGPSFLRTLFSITGALTGPLIGLFLVAIYLPWVNVKGASVGFLVSIILSLWIAVGQLLTQSPAIPLPLSTAGCPVSQPNSTTTNSSLLGNATTIFPTEEHILNTTTTILNLPTEEDIFNTTTTISDLLTEGNHTQDDEPDRSMYALSYCLNSVWGTIACILIAIVVTAITGTNAPKDVDQKLISQRAWFVFERTTIMQGRKSLIEMYLRRKSQLPQQSETNKKDKGEPEKEPLPGSVEMKEGHPENENCKGTV